jgi:uncharacterized protein YggE
LTCYFAGFTLRRSFHAVLHGSTKVEEVISTVIKNEANEINSINHRVEKFISTIMKNGANEIHSINFRSSKVKELKDQARIKAARYF